MALMRHQPRHDLLKWLVFNLFLLGCYLGFFHLCLIFDFPWSMLIGVAIALIVIGASVRFRHLFVNRFEFLIYLVLPLDVLLESMIPIHKGYSFYSCAVSFWMLFILYRSYQWICRNEAKPDWEFDASAETWSQPFDWSSK